MIRSLIVAALCLASAPAWAQSPVVGPGVAGIPVGGSIDTNTGLGRTVDAWKQDQANIKDSPYSAPIGSDATSAFQAASTAGGSTTVVRVPPGPWTLSGTVYTPSGGTWEMDNPSFPSGTSIDAVADGSVLQGITGKVFARKLGAAGNEFSAVISGVVPTTTGTASYEKATLYIPTSCQDPSDNTNTYHRDCVGVEAHSTIIAGNMTGRAWAWDSITEIRSGADGYAVGGEFGINNAGSAQPTLGTVTSKNGLHVVSYGANAATAAIVVDPTTTGFYHGLVFTNGAVLTGGVLEAYNSAGLITSINPDGTASFGNTVTIGANLGAASSAQGLNVYNGSYGLKFVSRSTSGAYVPFTQTGDAQILGTIASPGVDIGVQNGTAGIRVSPSTVAVTGAVVLGAAANTVGFYGATGIVKATLTGACAGNTGCQALAAELANLGLVTNSITN